MGMTPAEFYALTPREFFNTQKGWNDWRQFEHREAWERTRFMTTHLVNIHVARNKKIKPTDLVQFPWDKVRMMSPKEFDDFIK